MPRAQAPARETTAMRSTAIEVAPARLKQMAGVQQKDAAQQKINKNYIKRKSCFCNMS